MDFKNYMHQKTKTNSKKETIFYQLVGILIATTMILVITYFININSNPIQTDQLDLKRIEPREVLISSTTITNEDCSIRSVNDNDGEKKCL